MLFRCHFQWICTVSCSQNASKTLYFVNFSLKKLHFYHFSSIFAYFSIF
nr:MAG TPA: Tamulustoxin family protein [Caudoviricetes sp.]